MAVYRNVVLFDIDGTLLKVHGAGRAAFARALREAYGSAAGLENVSFAGATDMGVLLALEDMQDLPADPSRRARFFELLPEALRITLRDAPLECPPGASDLLASLAASPRVLLGLVTGNELACAHLKLEQAGFRDYFTFGAFGHEHPDRKELARRAWRRARVRCRRLRAHPGRRFLVGDTPADVEAARTIGAVSIGMSSGFSSAAALQAAGADIVIDDYADTGALLRLLEERPSQG